MHEAVTRARESLDRIVPFASEGNIGGAFVRIDEVFEELIAIAKIMHASQDPVPREFFTAHYSTNHALKVVRNDEFFERVAEQIGTSNN